MSTPKAVFAALFLSASALVPAAAVQAQSAAFSEPAKSYQGRVSFGSTTPGPIEAGKTVEAKGEGFRAGQTVRLFHGENALTGAVTADADGKFTASFTVPSSAAVGIHPIVVVSQAPYSAATVELKVSPTVPYANADQYKIDRAVITQGLYQSAYSAKNDAVFVASAVGRPPVLKSELVRVNARTLTIEARATPPEAADRKGPNGETVDGGLYAVYGVGVDDANGTVWTTNSRQNTVAVYRQSDLSLVRQFPDGTVSHARDVVIDSNANKAYVSATFQPEVVVFNAANPEKLKSITIQTKVGGRGNTAKFSAASLSLNAAAHRLFVVSNSTNEVAVINTQTDEVLNVFAVPGAKGTIGVSHDPQTGNIFVAAQGTDNLIVLNGETGAVVADTPVGAGALNVVFDASTRQAYVSNRGANSITVTDANGQIVANLGPAPMANHVSSDGKGTIFAVTKGSGDTEDANTLFRISPRK